MRYGLLLNSRTSQRGGVTNVWQNPKEFCTSLCHTGTEVTLVTKQHTVVLPLQVYVTEDPFFDTKKVFYEVLDFKNVFFTKN